MIFYQLMKIVVTTPTGNIGRKLVSNLIRAGIRPTVIVRDPSRIDPGVLTEVEALVGDQRDAAVLDRAFAGADAVFWLSPPDYSHAAPIEDYRSYGDAAVVALRNHKVPKLVHLSAVGAGHELGAGLIDGLTHNEKTFEGLETDVLHLRPGFFFENFLFQLDALRQGSYYSSFDPDVVTPFVATADIAQVAADRLLSSDWSGKSVQPLLGSEELTTAQSLERVGEGVGRKITYVQIPSADVVAAFAATGANVEVAKNYAKMLEYLNSNNQPKPSRTASSTSTTKLATWAFENLKPLLG